MVKLTLKQLEELVKENYNLVKALKKLNPQNNYQVGQTCFCPFHENHNTPAASIYSDDKGQSLYCFSERKLYTVVDVFKDLMHYDVYEIGNRLWKSMSEVEQKLWLSDHEAYEQARVFDKVEESSEKAKEIKKAAQLFMNKKITLNEMLGTYIKESK